MRAGEGRPVVAPLRSYRILDLTEGAIAIGPRMLSDLGADVIKIERPGGDRSRFCPPLDQSTGWGLAWLAHNAGKRSVSLDCSDDDPLVRLAFEADAVIGSSLCQPPPPFAELHRANPRLVTAHISAFGETGPLRQGRSSELIAQASGGLLHISGDESYPPAMLGVPLAASMAGAQLAVALMLALRVRGPGNAGVHIDLSMQEAVANLLFHAPMTYHLTGATQGRGAGSRTSLWPCADGYITWVWWVGPGWGRKNEPIISWMHELGFGRGLDEVNWEEMSITDVPPEVAKEWEKQFGAFFRRFTRRELYDEALRRRILLYPVNTPADVLQDAQLEARAAWTQVAYDGGAHWRAPGAWFRSDPALMELGSPPGANALVWSAPKVGQDNDQLCRSLSTAPGAPAAGTVTRALGSLPLDGLRVLDFCWAVVGPITTKYLAMFGATVVKIETRRRPDSLRMTGPYKDGRPGMNRSGSFANHNASKLSLALNLDDPAARPVIEGLVRWADVVTENFSPGVMERLGLGYDRLRAMNERIVMLSLSLQGQTGPRATHPGLGNHLQALSGIDHLTGFPDAPPGGPSQMLPDFIGPWPSLVALLGALDHRDATGSGVRIDLSQYEAILPLVAPALLDAAANGSVWERQGNRVSRAAPHGVFPVLGDDRWIAVAVLEDEQWPRLCGVLSLDAMAADARLATLEGRKADEDLIESAIAQRTRELDGHQLAEALQRAGVPASVVATAGDLLIDPQLTARGHYAWVRHEVLGDIPIDRPSFRIEGLEPRVAAGPLYASSTEHVLRDVLGFGENEIAELVASGAIEFE